MPDDLVRFWKKYKEPIHIAGFLLLFVFTAGGAWSKWQAQAADVEDLKTRTEHLELASVQVIQRLDDIITYLNVPHKGY